MRIVIVLAILVATVGSAAAQTTTWQWNNLDRFAPLVYNQAMRQNQGIVGMEALFPNFAMVSPATVSAEMFGNRTTHRSIDGFRRPHTGILTSVNRMTTSVTSSDDDVLMWIFPNPGDWPYESYIATGNTKARVIEGEIDVMDAFSAEIFTHGPKAFQQFTGFGPWIHEKHNYWDSRPHDYIEIHPLENFWWSELANGKMKYTIGIFSDNSGRFNAWRRNPVIALDAIAFEYQTGAQPLNYTMRVLTSLHMVPYPLFNDNAIEHHLMDGNQEIAVIREASSPNIHFSIDFARISKTPIPTPPGEPQRYSYKGLLKIHSAVKDGGHSIFTVQENTGGISLGRRISDLTVTLRSIRCVSESDRGDEEELYGAYGVSAVTGMEPFHVNVFSPGTTDGLLWRRQDFDPLDIRSGQTSQINGVRTFVLPRTGELVIYGDVDEEDEREGWGGDNDELHEPFVERIPVSSLTNGVPRLITHTYASGGTKIEVLLSVERRDRSEGAFPTGGVENIRKPGGKPPRKPARKPESK